MEELDYNKRFRFVLEQINTNPVEDVVKLYERVYDANVISPLTRNNVDIRKDLYPTIKLIQNLLSSDEHKTGDVYGETVYDFDGYYRSQVMRYPTNIQKYLEYEPEICTKEIEGKVLRGVNCRFALYINEHLIVERFFYVDGFNPESRWSVDLVDSMNAITNEIYGGIIRRDKKNIWDDYFIINRTGLNITDIREMSTQDRNRMLSKSRN